MSDSYLLIQKCVCNYYTMCTQVRASSLSRNHEFQKTPDCAPTLPEGVTSSRINSAKSLALKFIAIHSIVQVELKPVRLASFQALEKHLNHVDSNSIGTQTYILLHTVLQPSLRSSQSQHIAAKNLGPHKTNKNIAEVYGITMHTQHMPTGGSFHHQVILERARISVRGTTNHSIQNIGYLTVRAHFRYVISVQLCKW